MRLPEQLSTFLINRPKSFHFSKYSSDTHTFEALLKGKGICKGSQIR